MTRACGGRSTHGTRRPPKWPRPWRSVLAARRGRCVSPKRCASICPRLRPCSSKVRSVPDWFRRSPGAPGWCKATRPGRTSTPRSPKVLLNGSASQRTSCAPPWRPWWPGMTPTPSAAPNTNLRGRDFVIGACDDDTETVSVWGRLMAPDAAVMKQRDDRDDHRAVRRRSAQRRGAPLGCRRRDRQRQRHPGLSVRLTDCPTAECHTESNVVIRVIADQTAINEATAEQPAPPPPRTPLPKATQRPPARRCCWAAACCRMRCWPRRSATAQPSNRSACPAPNPSPAIGPAMSWPSSSACGICSADSPAATVSADRCDLDHVRPWPWGPTHASNLNCKCRKHHLMKTFWTGIGGWADEQLTDGTVVWTAPSGKTLHHSPRQPTVLPHLEHHHRRTPPTDCTAPTRYRTSRNDDAAPKTPPSRRHRRSNPSRTRTQPTRYRTLLKSIGLPRKPGRRQGEVRLRAQKTNELP